MRKTLSNGIQKFSDWFTIGRVGLLLLLIALPGGIINYRLAHPERLNMAELLEEFYANFSWELAGIAVTVLLIDRLYQRSEDEREQEQLVRQLTSSDASVARSSLEHMRAHGWLEDGLLRNASLHHTNLQGSNLREIDLHSAYFYGADLRQADLREAILSDAHLQGADLSGANLTSANLEGANLTGTKLAGATLAGTQNLTHERLSAAETLVGAIMPRGDFYDGRFSLSGDIRQARLAGYHIQDSTAMARFYQVSREAYLEGQRIRYEREQMDKDKEHSSLDRL